MAFNLADQYYVKALEVYDYDLEEVIINLNYALSYDPDHSGANELMGRIYMDQFRQFDKARIYLEEAIASDMNNIRACESLAQLFICIRKFPAALKLIDYSITISGARRDQWLRLKSLVFEMKKEYSQTLAILEQAKEECVCSDYTSFLNDEIRRVKNKLRDSQIVKYTFN